MEALMLVLLSGVVVTMVGVVVTVAGVVVTEIAVAFVQLTVRKVNFPNSPLSPRALQVPSLISEQPFSSSVTEFSPEDTNETVRTL